MDTFVSARSQGPILYSIVLSWYIHLIGAVDSDILAKVLVVHYQKEIDNIVFCFFFSTIILAIGGLGSLTDYLQ